LPADERGSALVDAIAILIARGAHSHPERHQILLFERPFFADSP